MNYTEIKAAALSFADRTDVHTENNMDNFFRMVESRVNRKIRTMGMMETSEIDVLPDSFADQWVVTLSVGIQIPVAGEVVIPQDNPDHIYVHKISNNGLDFTDNFAVMAEDDDMSIFGTNLDTPQNIVARPIDHGDYMEFVINGGITSSFAIPAVGFYPTTMSFALPATYAGARQIRYINGDKRETITLSTPEMVDKRIGESMSMDNGTDSSFGIKGYIDKNKLYIDRSLVDGKVSMLHYVKVPVLDADNLNNWLSDDYPDCYIFGLCVEISAFVKDGEAKASWDTRFKEALHEIKIEDKHNRWSGAPMQMQTV